MTDTERREADIIDSLATIRRHWSTLLDPPGGRISFTRAIAAGPKPDRDDLLGVTVADDHKPSEADIDRATRIVSLRREITDVLNAISRWVTEEQITPTLEHLTRRERNEYLTKILPDGTSALSMSLFLDRHAEWIATEDDGYEVDRLADLAHRARQLAAPSKREWVYLGDCPLVVEDWFCAGQVRSRIGGDGTARCSDCGTEQEIAWWEDVLGIGWAPVTLPKLVPILHDRLHITVTEQTLRNWRRDGLITPYVEPFGPKPQHMRFDVQTVLDQVARLGRTCVSCGREWHGYADVCTNCYVNLPPRPAKAHRRGPTPPPARLDGWCPWPRYREVVDRHDDDRPDRCHYSDLPLNMCACGRDHERMSA